MAGGNCRWMTTRPPRSRTRRHTVTEAAGRSLTIAAVTPRATGSRRFPPLPSGLRRAPGEVASGSTAFPFNRAERRRCRPVRPTASAESRVSRRKRRAGRTALMPYPAASPAPTAARSGRAKSHRRESARAGPAIVAASRPRWSSGRPPDLATSRPRCLRCETRRPPGTDAAAPPRPNAKGAAPRGTAPFPVDPRAERRRGLQKSL